MIITCETCQTKYKVDEEKYQGKKVKCPKCATVFKVPSALDATVGPSGEGPAAPVKDTTKVMNTQDLAEAAKALPLTDRRFSLAVLSGPMSGQVLPVTKSVFIIGRAFGDLILPDTEISRKHCQLEIYEDGRMLLKDLSSTNGTYYRGERITEIPIEDKTEFVVGKTSLMFIITDEE
jgi:predicted Zn finger-like uncharacterized protein